MKPLEARSKMICTPDRYLSKRNKRWKNQKRTDSKGWNNHGSSREPLRTKTRKTIVRILILHQILAVRTSLVKNLMRSRRRVTTRRKWRKTKWSRILSTFPSSKWRMMTHCQAVRMPKMIHTFGMPETKASRAYSFERALDFSDYIFCLFFNFYSLSGYSANQIKEKGLQSPLHCKLWL